jgi:hypothetical protein
LDILWFGYASSNCRKNDRSVHFGIVTTASIDESGTTYSTEAENGNSLESSNESSCRKPLQIRAYIDIEGKEYYNEDI